jgi:Ca2+-binding RTX toxin-like protein
VSQEVPKRLSSLLVGLAALAFAFSPSAAAGTVSLIGYQLSYVAPDGEANVVTVDPGPVDPATQSRTWLLTETGAPLVVGDGCTSVDADTASCNEPLRGDCSDLVVELSLGDGDDQADGSTGQPCDLFRLEIDGGEGSDTLSGAGYENSAAVFGGSGDDVLTGDGLFGGDGDDVITGVDWENYLDGGAGADTIQGEGIEDLIFGRSGADEVVAYAGFDWVWGGGGRDRIFAGPEDDVVRGGGGSDEIHGGGGSDRLAGKAGHDDLLGGRGRDRLRARDGYRDRVSGGRGFDSARIDDFDLLSSIERLF